MPARRLRICDEKKVVTVNMEKYGVIREGLTPPENNEKRGEHAGESDLEDHVTKRLSDAVEQDMEDEAD